MEATSTQFKSREQKYYLGSIFLDFRLCDVLRNFSRINAYVKFYSIELSVITGSEKMSMKPKY